MAKFVGSLRSDNLLYSWSTCLKGERASYPESMVNNREGHLIITDRLNKNVKIFTITGELKMVIDNHGKYTYISNMDKTI